MKAKNKINPDTIERMVEALESIDDRLLSNLNTAEVYLTLGAVALKLLGNFAGVNVAIPTDGQPGCIVLTDHAAEVPEFSDDEPKTDAGGRWFTHLGGKRPISEDALVQVEFRSGARWLPVRADEVHWVWNGSQGDIIKWRRVIGVPICDCHICKEETAAREDLVDMIRPDDGTEVESENLCSCDSCAISAVEESPEEAFGDGVDEQDDPDKAPVKGDCYDSGVWYPYIGNGECPVLGMGGVEVLLASGEIGSHQRPALYWQWDRGLNGHTIVAFRIVP